MFIQHYPGVHANAPKMTVYHHKRFANTQGWKWLTEICKDPNYGVLIYINGHVGAFKNGIVEDFTVNSSNAIKEIIIIRKKGA